MSRCGACKLPAETHPTLLHMAISLIQSLVILLLEMPDRIESEEASVVDFTIDWCPFCLDHECKRGDTKSTLMWTVLPTLVINPTS